MSFEVGWDTRQLSRAGPPFFGGFHWWAGARIRSLVPPCYGRTSQESFEKMVKDFGQWKVTWLIDDGGKGRRRRRATFDQTVIRGSEPHDMIRRGNICSTWRASDSNPKQGQNSKTAGRVGQTFSVNRLADGPCRQSSFLSVQWRLFVRKNLPHDISRELSSTYRRKQTLALRGRNQ